ncbi:UDP-4-amino-4,6-dideoxy-N-acetyl-beta-L-altrosamine transaminase [Paenibacillus athensensis]|uniref:UDP-4-amino-4, 6-dideoxy-N-acetyl-beta-L-altrosamine transaminase n=1 Tax=Paenibacillus athensensis TaxID=1967502 RepID=A0A4Y8Q4Q0_9BACL|nr:UDP-4-amino-4,6-dideoxy-N-acetyl-beta-L-altrosamine transaminase [Paenibacillus athensensis]MCD1260828.1 UDP-4-amino-4,6-dideoxy-N-acetyl-beta-L-altrosamine transaminase [Paenibacillus athensensis]
MSKLAIQGGSPIRDTMLPYGQQWVDGSDISAVIAALESNFITQGPQIEEFEKAVASYTGASYAIAFCNGTAALHGACFAAGIGQEDEVITTPITFLASSNAVIYQGGVPVFADILLDTYNIDPADIRQKISPKTKAIIAVDFTGQPADMDAIREIAEEYGLVLIEDAAHSLGAEYKGQKVGKLADMTMFSFHPVKHVTTGEGGVITTNSRLYYEKLLLFRNHGMTKDPSLMLKNDGAWYYEMIDLGYNYRMTDLQAALGCSQMQKLEQFVERRREIAATYTEAFSKLEGVITPYQHEKSCSSWHLYMLRFDLARFPVGRKVLFDSLRAENIGVHVHYIPVYSQPYYKKLGYTPHQCPVAEMYYESAITLPIFPKMTEQDVQDVIDSVAKVSGYYLDRFCEKSL